MEKNLADLVKQAGIVGAGGAGFPTHVKLDAKVDTVIVNGAECEPLLRVDQQLMALWAERLLKALQLVVDYTQAKEGVVALKKKYHRAEASLQAAVAAYPNLRLHFLDNFYPAGDEQVTVYEVTGRIVPEGGIPLQAGVVAINVETLLNVLDAVEKGLPVTEKYVTVTGAVNQPKTVRVPLGIRLRDVIDLAGGASVSHFVIINGGPMMGKIAGLDDPVTKTTKGLILLPGDHGLIKSLNKDMEHMLREARTACMHCSHCSEACPRGLLGHRIEPHKLIRAASYGGFCDEKTGMENAFLCSGCRLCEYACVMNLQPWKLNQYFKGELAGAGVKNTLNRRPEKADRFREYKKYPVHKLTHLLGLAKYDLPAPLEIKEYSFTGVLLPLKQHTGAPSVPVVKEGDRVKKGDLLAAVPEGKLGSALHASIEGTVTKITGEAVEIQA